MANHYHNECTTGRARIGHRRRFFGAPRVVVEVECTCFVTCSQSCETRETAPYWREARLTDRLPWTTFKFTETRVKEEP